MFWEGGLLLLLSDQVRLRLCLWVLLLSASGLQVEHLCVWLLLLSA